VEDLSDLLKVFVLDLLLPIKGIGINPLMLSWMNSSPPTGE
jgi:hypothetical protein